MKLRSLNIISEIRDLPHFTQLRRSDPSISTHPEPSPILHHPNPPWTIIQWNNSSVGFRGISDVQTLSQARTTLPFTLYPFLFTADLRKQSSDITLKQKNSLVQLPPAAPAAGKNDNRGEKYKQCNLRFQILVIVTLYSAISSYILFHDLFMGIVSYSSFQLNGKLPVR